MNRKNLLSYMRSLPAERRIITALDVPSGEQALKLAKNLGPAGGFVKIGLQLFSAAGPQIVQDMRKLGRNVFLDLKYHDIPNTVASAAKVAADLGVSMCTIHASAGRSALTAAAEALAAAAVNPDVPRPVLLAVTVLTSLSPEEMSEIGPGPDSVQDRVERLAKLAWECGCDGLVCSAADLPRLRQVIGPEPLVVTPGIRPAGSSTDDQNRIATPKSAIESGADFLVVGRPITQADDPAQAIAAIAAEIV